METQIHAISSCEKSKAAIKENYTLSADAKSSKMISCNAIIAENRSHHIYLDQADGRASRSASKSQGY